MCTFVHYLLIVGGSGFVSCLSNKESVKQYTATPTVLKKKKKKKTINVPRNSEVLLGNFSETLLM